MPSTPSLDGPRHLESLERIRPFMAGVTWALLLQLVTACESPCSAELVAAQTAGPGATSCGHASATDEDARSDVNRCMDTQYSRDAAFWGTYDLSGIDSRLQRGYARGRDGTLMAIIADDYPAPPFRAVFRSICDGPISVNDDGGRRLDCARLVDYQRVCGPPDP